jgi:hypothetical protein
VRTERVEENSDDLHMSVCSTRDRITADVTLVDDAERTHATAHATNGEDYQLKKVVMQS